MKKDCRTCRFGRGFGWTGKPDSAHKLGECAYPVPRRMPAVYYRYSPLLFLGRVEWDKTPPFFMYDYISRKIIDCAAWQPSPRLGPKARKKASNGQSQKIHRLIRWAAPPVPEAIATGEQEITDFGTKKIRRYYLSLSRHEIRNDVAELGWLDIWRLVFKGLIKSGPLIIKRRPFSFTIKT